ncbi:hypothetical protein GE061_001285 [Apolygus lucorum]|uniref:Uncharacterized protein n=1 Tax=Apolygus lucorum TaxID=248454 RepID=A0A8S9Y7U8_APOLU|nr:hypothetical protein GE061_001285 [Apolygus lucorum]
MDHRDSDLEGSMDEAPKFSPRFLNQQVEETMGAYTKKYEMSNNENDMSEPEEDGPEDAPNGTPQTILTKINRKTVTK